MATGDITSIKIAEEGWYAQFVISGFGTGASYDFGFNGDINADGNVPTENTPYFIVNSEGFNESGNLTTLTRKIYTTIQQRQAYPNDSLNQESGSGGSLVFEAVLSDFIYNDDKNGGAGTAGIDPVFYAPSGWVTWSGHGSRAATGISVVNSSTLDYSVPIANWTTPDRSRITGNSLELRAIGFHACGSGQKPLAGIGFTATDGTNTSSGFINTPTYDSVYNDPNPVIEYIGSLDISSFTPNSLITANFQAYPLIGDTGAIYDSTSGSATSTVNKFTFPQKYLYDPSGSSFAPIAVVGTNGSALGIVGASDTNENRSTCSGTPFGNIAQAMSGLSSYLTTGAGRSDIAGATIYLLNGTHEIVGSDVANSVPMSSGESVLTIKPFPNATGVNCIPNSNNIIRSNHIKLENLTLTRSGDSAFVDLNNNSTFITKDCIIQDTRSTTSTDGIFDNETSMWHINSTFKRVKIGTSFYRGCNFAEGDNLGRRKFLIGCIWQPYNNPTSIFLASTSSSNTSDGAIFAYNKIWNCQAGVADYPGVGNGTFSQGMAVVQNVIEFASGSGDRLLRFAADGNETETHNCVIAHNTVVGELCNMFYQDVPQTRKQHLGHVVVLNVLESMGSKTDDFADDGRCTGNWPVYNGCGLKGNRIGGGNFPTRFRGLWSIAGEGDYGQATYLVWGFVDDNSAGGSATGNGDYHPSLVAVFKFVGAPQMLKWDIDGEERMSIDAAGAFRYRRNDFIPLAPKYLRTTPSLYIFTENFEGSGTPSGWTTDASGWNFDATSGAIRGAQSLSVSGSTSGTLRGVYTPTINFPASGEVFTIYMIVKMTTIPTGGTGRFMELRRASDNLIQNILRVNTSGQISAANGSDAGSTGNYQLTLNTEAHLWIQKNADGTLSVYASANSTKPSTVTFSATGSNAGQSGNLHIGFARSGVILVDEIKIQPGVIGSNP